MAVVTAAIAAAGLAYSIVQGERGAAATRKGLRQQRDAQQFAEDAALRQERQAVEAQRKASRRPADVSTLLAGERGMGISSMLSGPAGVALGRLKLGRSSALGG